MICLPPQAPPPPSQETVDTAHSAHRQHCGHTVPPPLDNPTDAPIPLNRPMLTPRKEGPGPSTRSTHCNYTSVRASCLSTPLLVSSPYMLNTRNRGKEYGILFIFSLFCEYIHLEYVRIHVIYKVNQAEYVIHILVVALQEYVNIYSTLGSSPLRLALTRYSFGSRPLHKNQYCCS